MPSPLTILIVVATLTAATLPNTGSAVGLFSNRNHNAIFLSIALMLCVMQAHRHRLRRMACHCS